MPSSAVDSQKVPRVLAAVGNSRRPICHTSGTLSVPAATEESAIAYSLVPTMANHGRKLRK